MKTHYITNWEQWLELCRDWAVDPHKYTEFGYDTGGGNNIDFEYIGDIPTDICTCSDCKKRRSK